ncbi:hypothetical protein RQP46_003528 [Phenoliferia psychrophenolica]
MNPKLAKIVSRFEKSMKQYERAVQAVNAPESDNGKTLTAQREETLLVIRKTLSDAVNLAAEEVSSAGSDIDTAEIRKLFADISKLEERAVSAAYGNSDEWRAHHLVRGAAASGVLTSSACTNRDLPRDDNELCDFLEPSCEPIVLAPIGGSGSLRDSLDKMLKKVLGLEGKPMPDIDNLPVGDFFKPAPPYSTASRPSRHTTPLAHIFNNTPARPPSPLLLSRAILEARCEVTSDRICSPNQVLVSASKVFVSASGGWKNRDPILHTYQKSLRGSAQGPRVGLAGLIEAMALDGVDDLVAVADDSRVKTYRGDLPVHTMSSRGFYGPLAFVEGGKKLLRVGKGGIAVWHLEGLATHGDEGKKLIGGKIRRSQIDTMRDEDGGDDEIERSVGSAPTSTSPLDPSISTIANWTAISPTSFICASAVDDHGTVEAISVADGRPDEFVTACSDGVVRLYDIRCPKPSISFGLKDGEEPAYAAAFADVGGQPFVFLGGSKSEQITAFDARVPGAACYSLATGNNHVRSLAWQASTQSLWAATTCTYVDRMGYHHDYRAAKLRNPDAGSDEDEDEDDGDDDIAWPSKAYHRENAFGHPFDAGEHRLYRYQFKDQADPKIVPPWGQATVGESHGYGW